MQTILPFSPTIEFFNMNTVDGKKKGFKVKNEWAAKANPFVLIEDNGKAIKAFYSETGDTAINQFLTWCKNEYSKGIE